jgi:hypothetical protein
MKSNNSERAEHGNCRYASLYEDPSHELTWRDPPRRVSASRLSGTIRYEEGIGDAMQAAFKAGTVRREDFFVTTKLWHTNHRTERVKPAFASLRPVVWCANSMRYSRAAASRPVRI